MKNPLKNERLLRLFKEDDGIAMMLKLLAIAAVSALVFGFTKLALLGFFVGLTMWLLGRTVRLVLAGAELAEVNKKYTRRLERRVRDLEFRLMKIKYESIAAEPSTEPYERAS